MERASTVKNTNPITLSICIALLACSVIAAIIAFRNAAITVTVGEVNVIQWTSDSSWVKGGW